MTRLSSSSQSTVLLLTTLAIVSAVTILTTARYLRRRRSSCKQGGNDDDALRDLVLDEEQEDDKEEEEELNNNKTGPVNDAVNLPMEKKQTTQVLSTLLPYEILRQEGVAAATDTDALLNKDIQTSNRRSSRRSATSSNKTKKEKDSAGPTPSTKVASCKGITVRSNNNKNNSERRESHYEEDASGDTRTTANEEDEEDTTEDSIAASRDEGTTSELSASDDESYFFESASQEQDDEEEETTPHTAGTTPAAAVPSSNTSDSNGTNIRVARLPIELDLQYQDRSYIEPAKYSGPLVNGQPHGMGVLWFENGSMYVGEFHMSEMHGAGAFNYKRKGNRSSQVYRGEFVHNEFVPLSSSPSNAAVTTTTVEEDENEPDAVQLSPSSSSSVDHGPVRRVRVRETLKHTIEAYLCVTQAKKEKKRSGKGRRHEIRR